jgi:hypothetical protein
MKRTREPHDSGCSGQLLPENWALVRHYLVRLMLWDQWYALLAGLERENVHVRGYCACEALPIQFVYIMELESLQWYRDRIGVLVCGNTIQGDSAYPATGEIHNRVCILLSYEMETEDKSKDYDDWLTERARDVHMRGVLTMFVKVPK